MVELPRVEAGLAQMARAGAEVKSVGGAFVRFDEKPPADLRERREIVVVDHGGRVVLRVVLAALELAREGRDVDAGYSGGEERPHLRPRGRLCEPKAVRQQAVRLGAAAE